MDYCQKFLLVDTAAQKSHKLVCVFNSSYCDRCDQYYCNSLFSHRPENTIIVETPK